MDLVELFCDIDDHVKALGTSSRGCFLTSKTRRSGTAPRMSLSEIMTIVIWYHSSGFKNFKRFYLCLVQQHSKDFPNLLSYTRFLDWVPYCLLPISSFLKSRMGKTTGISFIDSTPINVCHNIRIRRNRVFKDMAERGKSSMGWFFGFKLHMIVNERGELLALKITKGNTNDRVPVKFLCKNIFGKLYGDKGYLGKKLFKELFEDGVELITNVKSNMKNQFLHLTDKIMLRKRFIIETINDQLKNISDIEHSRHRSPTNFMINLLAGLVSYCYQEKKPAIKMPNRSKLLA